MTLKLYATFPCTFDNFTIIWKETDSKVQIERVFLSDYKLKSSAKALESFNLLKKGSSLVIDNLAKKIQLFFSGEEVKFDLELLDFSRCTEIQKKVLLAEYEIPRGWVSTYKRIANQIGKTNGARVVGNSLAKNPFPILIPCHRAIRSNGELGGFQGGLAMKHALLELEGRIFTKKGKVVMERIYY
ncbi:MAG: methylated-DNA--[protein]-cysteine S-methyltransferase [Candidatus Heimdallarchaeota archaeon]|nr:methylated-DNA--[protein]-cysteine S-methyltransferase [Candidatus Heimdallarchaeota archaeon]